MRKTATSYFTGVFAYCPVAILLIGLASVNTASASEAPQAVERSYTTAPAAPTSQSAEEMQAKSAGCVSCHTGTDEKTMHPNPAVKLGCTDCHGGDASVQGPAGGGSVDDAPYLEAMEKAHVLPRFPQAWHFPSSANPERTYTLLNRESPEFVRFINPSAALSAPR